MNTKSCVVNVGEIGGLTHIDGIVASIGKSFILEIAI